jgi:hypothetical protein
LIRFDLTHDWVLAIQYIGTGGNFKDYFAFIKFAPVLPIRKVCADLPARSMFGPGS